MTHLNPEDLTEKADEEILTLSIERPAVFEVLVKKYEKAFLRKAHVLLGRREEAEDAVQEAFMKIYFHAGRFKKVEGASFQSWGYKILTNTCFTLYKKRKRREEKRVWMGEEGALENLPDLNFRHAREDEDFREQALSFISRLPGQMRRMIEMHFVEGLPQKEIAAAEGVSVGAVKIRIFRAKKELQKIYKEQEEQHASR
ncbi:RNA polymerase sigma factor [bacterium]|nr:RNA polymerase sigma factor [bacterium]